MKSSRAIILFVLATSSAAQLCITGSFSVRLTTNQSQVEVRSSSIHGGGVLLWSSSVVGAVCRDDSWLEARMKIGGFRLKKDAPKTEQCSLRAHLLQEQTACKVVLGFGAGNSTGDATLTFEPYTNALGDALLRMKVSFTSDAREHARFRMMHLRYPFDEGVEGFLGFGEQYNFLNAAGRRVPFFTQEQGIGRGLQPLTQILNDAAYAGGSDETTYTASPYWYSTLGRGFFLNSSFYSQLDLRRGLHGGGRLTVNCSDGFEALLFTYRLTSRNDSNSSGSGPSDAIRLLTAPDLLGRPMPLPDWSIRGAIVGMQGGSEKVRKVLSQLTDRDPEWHNKWPVSPLAGLWLQDWSGSVRNKDSQTLWWNWEYDSLLYPDWPAFVQEMRAQGIRVLSYLNPMLHNVTKKPNARHDYFKIAVEKGYLVLDGDGKVASVYDGAGLLDFTNPDAWAWFRDEFIIKNTLALNVSGWMCDFSEALPLTSRLKDGSLAAWRHNQYPDLWYEMNREAVKRMGLDNEVMFFGRAGHLRSIPLMNSAWQGDQLINWDAYDGIESAIVSLISSGLSGIPYQHSDIGGYTNIPYLYKRSQELLLRWMELSAFTVLFRTHDGSLPSQNWLFHTNKDTMERYGRYAQIYASWYPLRAALVRDASITGLPVARALYLTWPSTATLNVTDTFTVGTSFLVTPVVKPRVSKVAMYVPPPPAGSNCPWVHLWTGKIIAPPYYTRITISAPLGQPAVLYSSCDEYAKQFVSELRTRRILSPEERLWV